jgi:hypothetical protein
MLAALQKVVPLSGTGKIDVHVVTYLEEHRDDGTFVSKKQGQSVSAVTVQQISSQRYGVHAVTNVEIPW